MSFYITYLNYLHAARNTERGGDSRKNTNGYLNHHFPSVFLHHLLLLKVSTIFFFFLESAKRLAGFELERKQERKSARRPAGFAIRR